MGELCLSPVGLSAVTRMSVKSIVGVMMGVWFLATAYSELLAVKLAQFAAIDIQESQFNVRSAIVGYNELFEFLLLAGLATGLILLLITPLLKKMLRTSPIE